MATTQQSIGVVLAGGRSSRMGRDKALLPTAGNRTFLDHACALLRELPLAQVVVSGARPGGVPDLVPGRGPLGGLHAVASATKAPAALVIPVDMPLLPAGALARLLHAGVESGRASYFGDYFFPLWLPLDTGCRAYLQRAVEGDAPNAVGALLRHLGALSLPGAGDWCHNVNTPADYYALPGSALPGSARFVHPVAEAGCPKRNSRYQFSERVLNNGRTRFH
ncbi:MULTISPECIES: molybdenum cofactor guanylyltransferase [unclassified Microbulbifer]|uniref:molybdenum cofactor guanylyltransferase n=1 Tax=unclassified Microbulbifer TaxID=2619833 RepID=UPI001E530EAB|nr:molybdenum cofactor guanylyltransferase [Microbulbifer sp. YPW16]UHQ56540.1 molybdenum cofactor guanylyltransferase [Microbulbifer sp. YPW16]